ncbi:MAG TPA: hypothetical protein VHS33_02450 [Sphingomicrobium sp.]|jgi:hypothetical protein|nr:hypothetical protein [Sphingomicrobium sp.]
MATLAERPFVPTPVVGDEGFFLRGAIVMTITIISGFGFAYLMGRSTFEAPLRVQFHAWVFMGWVGIYLLQNILVATGKIHLHRRLGWIAAAWLIPMIVMGLVVTGSMVRRGHVPFFFRPLQFLIFDPVTVFTFAGLTIAAILMRRRTEWHRRLHFCGMSMLLMPAIARLLPLPLMQPWAYESAFAVSVIFPLVGVGADVRRSGHAHPAWQWGIATMVGAFVLVELITYSPAGTAIYSVVTAGSPGAAIAPLQFAPPPPGPLVTGR